jgi:hypothetical protein
LPRAAEIARSINRFSLFSESLERSRSLMNRSVSLLVRACVVAWRILAMSALIVGSARLPRVESTEQ